MNISPVGGYKVNPRFGLSDKQKKDLEVASFKHFCTTTCLENLINFLPTFKDNQEQNQIMTDAIVKKINHITTPSALYQVKNSLNDIFKDKDIPDVMHKALLAKHYLREPFMG